MKSASALESAKRKMKEGPQPGRIRPMLAVLAQPGSALPKEGWIFEPKLDGQRCLAFKNGDAARLISRSGRSINGNYPELVRAILEQPATDFIVDGEIVAFRGGLPSFEELQPRMQIADPGKALQSGIRVFFYLFDLIYFEGHDITGLPLELRKGMLGHVISFRDPLRNTPFGKDGEAIFNEQCRRGGEGILAKRADSVYVQRRSAEWLKFKCSGGQEFVIAGFTDPSGARKGYFGALLLGYYKGDGLVYAGKVGTGFDAGMLKFLYGKLRLLEQDSPPFADAQGIPKTGVHWVRPELVCEVVFSEWTRDGLLRHPSFKGLRTDKRPGEVRREAG